jgi:DNA-directed RNA polymerase subunit M/transcription elongation factor TFIIS
MIQIACPKGHRLSVAKELAGRIVACPKCDSRVPVPRNELSDSSVVAILTQDASERAVVRRPLPARTAGFVSPRQNCPQCETEFSAHLSICPKCQTYVSSSVRQPATLGVTCPTCGAATFPQDVACARCGGSLRMVG